MTRRYCKGDFGPWFKSQKSLISFFLMDDRQKKVDKYQEYYFLTGRVDTSQKL